MVDQPKVGTSHSHPQKIASPPVAINVHIDENVRRYLKLPHGYRKVRISVSTKQERENTIASFRSMIEKRIQPLQNQPYQLRYKLKPSDIHYQTLQKDMDFQALLSKSVEEQCPLLFRLQGVAGIFPPMSDANSASLNLLPVDPNDSPSYNMVSFFSFYPIEDPKTVQAQLFDLWRPMEVLGRVYVAKEGINAQMAIPSNIFAYFVQRTKELPYFEESRFNTDRDVSREIYEQSKPFRNLHIRVRSQIVADGLEGEIDDAQAVSNSNEEGLDWRKSGKELSPLEWHQSLSKGLPDTRATPPAPFSSEETNNAAIKSENIKILDCRNIYETDVGIFDSAIPLNTTFFRESWTALDEILEEVPKDQPIYTYCTGGIRCVKINAYLEQKLGFTNTYRLQGGIIAYRRELERLKQEQLTGINNSTIDPAQLESQFQGINYVFDERIGERITEKVLTSCEMCGEPCDTFRNCPACNVRFLQCEKCGQKYHHFCSLTCQKEQELRPSDPRFKGLLEKKRPKNFSQLMKSLREPDEASKEMLFSSQQKKKRSLKSREGVGSNIDESSSTSSRSSPTNFPVETHALFDGALGELIGSYAEKYSEAEPPLLAKLRQETEATYPAMASRMLSGPTQGAVFSFLAGRSSVQTVLELGSFTGYSALSFATPFERFSDKATAQLPFSQRMKEIHTCEIDPKAIEIAERYFDQLPASFGQIFLHRESAKELITRMRREGKRFDLVFIDADKKEYLNYLQSLLGEDGEERGMKEDNCLLNDRAFIVIDNTLWKGLVLKEDEEISSKIHDNASPMTLSSGDLKDQERYRKIAKKMHALNAFARNHRQLRSLFLPIRDGLTILQYIKSPASF